jgi:hypothetical protein
MVMKPEDVRLHNIDTSKGSWGIYVQTVVEAQNNDNLFLKVILERNISDERIEMRRLELLVFSAELVDPQQRARLIAKIQNWIEATEGDGFLDLVSQTL